MYATTYDFDARNIKVLVQLVSIDGIIFYNDRIGTGWSLSYKCAFGNNKICVPTHDLANVLSIGYMRVDPFRCTYALGELHRTLNHIHTIYRFSDEAYSFKQHTLDERWDDIVMQVLADLW